MTLTKTVKFDPDVLAILASAVWEKDGTFMRQLPPLDRTLYEKVDKALKLLGGKWNRKLAGHTFASDPRVRVAGLLDEESLTVEKLGFFETPVELADRMADELLVAGPQHNLKVLEPSAGTGRLCEAVYRANSTVKIDVCELDEVRREKLSVDWYVIGDDFMQVPIRSVYDRVIMNPPFESGQSITHTLRAWDFLKSGGRLVGIMAAGAFFGTDARSLNFRAWFNAYAGYEEVLPSGTFKESGTNVKSHLIIVNKETME